MNRWAANNPDLYEQLGHEGYLEYLRDRADWECERQKEEGEVGPPESWAPVGLYACATCGEPVRHYGQRCDRCKASIEEDRLERESGR